MVVVAPPFHPTHCCRPPTDREERMPLILFPMKNARAKCDDCDVVDQNKKE